jgi:hypothetical protein
VIVIVAGFGTLLRFSRVIEDARAIAILQAGTTNADAAAATVQNRDNI